MHYALPMAVDGCPLQYDVRSAIDAQKLTFGHALRSTEACLGRARAQRATKPYRFVRVFRPSAARDQVLEGAPGTAHQRT